MFESIALLDLIWKNLKGNLKGDVSYQFYGVIQYFIPFRLSLVARVLMRKCRVFSKILKFYLVHIMIR